MHEKRTGIGKTGEIVGSSGAFGLLVFESIFHRERDLRRYGQQNSQMIRSEGVTGGLVHGEDTDNPVETLQRHDESGLQNSMFFRFHSVSGFNLRVTVHNRLTVLSDPSAEAFAYANLQRRKHAEVVATHQLGQQPAVAINKNCDGIVWNHAQ